MATYVPKYCEGCHGRIEKYDDYVELDHGQFYHWSCRSEAE